MDDSSSDSRLVAFFCPSCKQEIEVSSNGIGHTIDCPACGASIVVPGQTDPAIIQRQNQSLKSRTIRIDLDDNW